MDHFRTKWCVRGVSYTWNPQVSSEAIRFFVSLLSSCSKRIKVALLSIYKNTQHTRE